MHKRKQDKNTKRKSRIKKNMQSRKKDKYTEKRKSRVKKNMQRRKQKSRRGQHERQTNECVWRHEKAATSPEQPEVVSRNDNI